MSEPKDSGSAIEIGENGKGKRVDPGFKLFGKTIPVCHSSEIDAKADEDTACENSKEEEVQGNTVLKAEGDEGNSNEGEGKPALKKPDKLLPCPRCESMDTKFCYYNNYNVNQPRHFCKKCQRYWTAGGTLRNVPVGAGRRKNKHSASVSAYRHVVSSDGGLAVRTEDPEGDRVVIPCALPAPCLRPLKIGNSRIQVVPAEAFESAGAVLKFGGGADADAQIEWQSREDDSCGSSITGSASAEKDAGRVNCGQGSHSDRGGSSQFGLKVGCVQGLNGGSPVPFYGGPWSYGWGFGYGSPSWNGPGWVGVPWAVGSGSFLGPAAANWGPGPWAASSSPNSSDSGSPSLGKHSRERSQPDCKTDGCLWVPKTLRIDDPGEAAKSSIWTTLGLGNKSRSTITGGGIFKAFQPKMAEGMKDSIKAPAPPQVVHVNPAAFSRSVAFQESS